MKPTLLLWCFLTPIFAVAQFGVEVEMGYGTTLVWSGSGPDDSGQRTTLGVNLAYYTRDTNTVVLRMGLRHHSVSGLVSIKSFSQEVPALDPAGPPTLVSMRAYVPSYRAVSLGIAVETGPLWGPFSQRWRGGMGVGILRLSRETPRVEWYEQSTDGEQLGPRTFGDTFTVRDGEITRFGPGFNDPDGNNALRRYQAYLEVHSGYQLTPYLQVFSRQGCTLGSLGKRYGGGMEDTLLGGIYYVQIGLLGRL